MPARGVVVSSFTKFDGVSFSNLTTGELTQLMGRAGRRGIDVIGHGVILKESDIEIGTIYEVAMGPTLVVESKFLPSYNMALNLLRVYTPQEAEALMERSFGQFQKRLAADRTRERLQNVRARLEDIRHLWNGEDVSIEDVAQYYKLEDRRRAIRIELKRLRRDAGAERRNRRGRHTRAQGQSSRLVQKLEIEARALLERQRKLKVVRSPRFGEYLQRYGEIRGLQKELEAGERRPGRWTSTPGSFGGCPGSSARPASSPPTGRPAKACLRHACTARTRSWLRRRCGPAGSKASRQRSCARSW
jgi:ATP-dependent RNA helicase HelY